MNKSFQANRQNGNVAPTDPALPYMWHRNLSPDRNHELDSLKLLALNTIQVCSAKCQFTP